ncbi:hypothetical protein [Solirubrobacter soli]|uniref:hypothetical protein n=1 Tax=Solirubrobacter soli TaxID=363832 RepID=UPI000405F987|nr:hypothetical protein [Solirubrobacter soli]
MRWMTMAAILALAGCGADAAPHHDATTAPRDARAGTPGTGGATPAAPPSAETPAAGPTRRSAGPGGQTTTATATATPARVTAVPNGPWALRAGQRVALRCPASSSRAGWPPCAP